MGFENFGAVPETAADTSEDLKLSAFQNASFAEMMENDLMPKIRFTTDAAEAAEAAQSDRSDPLHLPDAVFYVEAPEDAGEKTAAVSDSGSFQNDSFGIDVRTFTKDTAGAEGSGEYVGPSPDAISLKMDSDVKHLTYAQEQLDEAIARGTGVMTAMRGVESAQAVLDADMKLYNEAIAFRAPEAPAAPAGDTGSENGERKLGSVSHAQWKLEQAYKNDNKIAIENAQRDLAREKSEEEAKK